MAEEEDDNVMESMEGDEMECGDEPETKPHTTGRAYLPTDDILPGEKLVYDESAYLMYHQASTGAPCLSFDIIRDDLGDERTTFPLSAYLVAGTQAEGSRANSVVVMKMYNLHETKKTEKKEEQDDDETDKNSDDEEDDNGKAPIMECALIRHSGAVNRIRATNINDKHIAAAWSENGSVNVLDLTYSMSNLTMSGRDQKARSQKPMFSFKGHLCEGFAVDWSTTVTGNLLTGDCNKHIHFWKLLPSATWHVDQRPYTGHSASVEDIQWSPNEASVFASCSVDRSIRIWDIRSAPSKACMLTTENAHASDINVISWNKREPFIVSGGDDGLLRVWDLRQFQEDKPVATFKHHTAPLTSVEWNPNDSTGFAASGADDQVTLWDLSVEKDEASGETTTPDIPPQLLFIHQGQNDIKEVHWHPQLPGVLISTANTGFNIFRTISV